MPSYGSSRVKGITIEIGGDTTKLDKALGSVNHELTTMQKDLSAVERRLKLDPTNTELLAQKQRLLAETITKTADRMKILESGSDGLKRSLDEGKISAEDYEKKSKALGLELAVTESDMKSAERALADLNDEMKKAGSPADDMADALKDVGDAAADATDGMGGLSGSLSGLKGVALGVSTAVGEKLVDAASEAAKWMWSLDDATEEYREAIGKLNTAFETAGYSQETATEAYKAFYAILGDTDTAAEAGQLLAQLANDEKEMARWTEIAAGVYGTFGDALPINGLIEAANETAKVGKVTGALADALNWVGINEDDFNETLKDIPDSANRASLVMDTLAHTYRAAADAFYENNEALIASREASMQFEQAMADLAEDVQPLLTMLAEMAATFLGWFNNLPEGAKAAAVGVGIFLGAIGPISGIISGITGALSAMGVASTAFSIAGHAVTLTMGQWAIIIAVVVAAVLALVAAIALLTGKSKDIKNVELPEVPDYSGAVSGGGRKTRASAYYLPTAFAEDLPHLARGGVIQPNNPFLAVVGDNTQEREIIAPESTLEQTVQRAMARSGAGFSAQRITIPITLELDGSIVARKMYTYNVGEAERRGPQLVN